MADFEAAKKAAEALAASLTGEDLAAKAADALARKCAVCARPGATKTCGRCTTRYCSVRCQKLHWPKHRRLCARGGDLKTMLEYRGRV